MLDRAMNMAFHRSVLRAAGWLWPCFALGPGPAWGQCGTVVSAFPYEEGFESGPAWTSGGNSSDWAWGAPAHPLIASAAEGANAWCIGGLAGTFYNYGQQSWLQSPCFDLSSLDFPHVAFSIFWECERTYDGLTFQYSLNEGATWNNVGTYDAPEDCLNAHWFNTFNIVNLNAVGQPEGWSGRVGPTDGSCGGGGGSGEWVRAAQCLEGLANAPSVVFRFAFGAGTTCNSYDGIAIDDFVLADGQVTASFAQQCDGTQVLFQETTAPCSSTRSWDFGDPASGAANTSTAVAPAHTYAVPGTYTVTLTATGPCGNVSTVVQEVVVLDVEVQTTAPDCQGNGGTATAVLGGPNVPVTYAWSPGGGSTAVITGLPPGTYTVTVGGMGVCPVQATGTVAEGEEGPQLTLAAQDVGCHGLANGTITASASGGTPGYVYAWAPEGGDQAVATGLASGTYTCTITDAAGCSTSATITLEEPDALVLDPQPDRTICAGGSTSLEATFTGGTGPYAVHYAPDGPSVSPLQTTTYWVWVEDANGCLSDTSTVVVEVRQVVPPVFVASDSAACVPACAVFNLAAPVQGALAWTFGDGSGSTAPSPVVHCYATEGSFVPSVMVIDAFGCAATYALPHPIVAHPLPVPAFVTNPAVVTIDDPVFHFIDNSSHAAVWSWDLGDPAGSTSTGPDPWVTYTEVGCYEVRLDVTSTFGCTASTLAEVCVEDEFMVFVPNAFTPNGDGINDELLVRSTVRDPERFEFTVYDRWGRALFRSQEQERGWQPTDVPQGLYNWHLRMHDAHGSPHERRGHVTLLR